MITQLGGRVIPVAQLGAAGAGATRIYLGHFGGKLLAGGRAMSVPNAGLQALEGLASRLGGRTLAGMPGNIEALRSSILSASEIVFNVGAGGLQAGSLTAAELQLIINAGALSRVTFVTGLTQ